MNFEAIESEVDKKRRQGIALVNHELDLLPAGERLIIVKLDNEIYHACKGISSSHIKYYSSHCGESYRAKYLSRPEEIAHQAILKQYSQTVQKSIFETGTAFHALLLEPGEFAFRYIRRPDKFQTRGSNAYKAFAAEKRAQGITVLDPKTFYDLKYFYQVAKQHEELQNILRLANCEVSYFYHDPESGLILKCRADISIDLPESRIFYDPKTCECASKSQFERTAANCGYYLQDVMYCDVGECDQFYFIAIERHLPFIINMPLVLDDPHERQLAKAKYRQCVLAIADSLETGDWSDYESGSFHLPIYLTRSLENEFEYEYE